MTASLTLQCDVPGCTVTDTRHSLVKPDAGRRRTILKELGWTTTRVANPFYDDTRRWDVQTYVLDRCPRHAGVLLWMEKVAEHTYKIHIKLRKQPAKPKEGQQ